MAERAHLFLIAGRSVTETEFREFLGTLVQVAGTWYCLDMSFVGPNGTELGGGTTGYDARGPDGSLYEVTDKDTPEAVRSSITRKNTPL